MKIGIFGGAFDPIHRGHTETVNEISQQFALDTVIFVPLKNPVHKPHCEASPADRLAMLALALEAYPQFDYSPVELERAEKSYSVYTVRFFRERFPDAELFLIMGSDSFNTIRSWKSPEEIAGLCRFIVMERPGFPVDFTLEEEFGKILVGKNCLIEISSSEIRKGQGKERLHPEVLRYIEKKGLYLH